MFCQQANICSCEGLVDTDYKNAIDIYKAPLGQIKHKIKQDFKNEDYLIFTIDKDSANYFHLTFSYAISGKKFTGWVKKANYFGTHLRVYTGTLKLYNKPNSKSVIETKTDSLTNDLLPIIACKDKWVYVNHRTKNELYVGWLQEKDQCANPYTTCN
ncbi:MAG TPA: hypothetical protein VLC98_11870 [Phnomibacter sp.]|nr:hypothetical protein [Phnomibacter sp.]